MILSDAQAEVEQYVCRNTFECPGSRWRWKGWRGIWPTNTVKTKHTVSCQLALPGVPPWDFAAIAAPRAYMRAVNFNALMRRLIADAGRTVRRVPPPPDDRKLGAEWRRPGPGHRAYVAFIKAIRAAGGEPRWTVCVR